MKKQDWVFKLVYLLGCLDIAAVVIVGTLRVGLWLWKLLCGLLEMCNGLGIAFGIASIAAFGTWLVVRGGDEEGEEIEE